MFDYTFLSAEKCPVVEHKFMKRLFSVPYSCLGNVFFTNGTRFKINAFCSL